MTNVISTAFGIRVCHDPVGRLTDDTDNSYPAVVESAGLAFVPSHAYLAGDVVLPSGAQFIGLHAVCTTPGTAGGSEPTWATTEGGTTTSSGATFTMHTVGYSNYSAGIRHNASGPAQQTPSGSLFYYINGYLHRSTGPAWIIKTGGYGGTIVTSLHYQNGVLIDPTLFATCVAIGEAEEGG